MALLADSDMRGVGAIQSKERERGINRKGGRLFEFFSRQRDEGWSHAV